MRKVFLLPLFILIVCCSAVAQQAPAQPQPLTFYYDYKVNPGKEEEFMNLIKTVGAPVRDKLMAEGVVLAWGMETPVLRYPGSSTHWIWFSVANWDGVEKVLTAMETQQARIAAEDAKAADAARAAKKEVPMSTAQRTREVIDSSKTRDWVIRDLVGNYGAPPAGNLLPYTRYNFTKVKPGKAAQWRQTWEKYNKPVLDKLITDGVLLAYGLATEEVKTDGDFTHFVWMATANLAALDKVAAAFAADRARRSEDERTSIAELFASLTEPDMARSMVTRSRIFKIGAPPKVSSN